MANISKKFLARKSRQKRVRKKVNGTATRPRLAVFRSAKHIYVQAIDDEKGHTLASASTIEYSEQISTYTGNKDAASIVGKIIAERLLKKSIQSVVFDRGGFLYQGRVQTLAGSAREHGLLF